MLELDGTLPAMELHERIVAAVASARRYPIFRITSPYAERRPAGALAPLCVAASPVDAAAAKQRTRRLSGSIKSANHFPGTQVRFHFSLSLRVCAPVSYPYIF